MSVSLTGAAMWLEMGPRAMFSAGVDVPPDDQATGAVESIAISPADPTQIVVGTVNGGVWRADNVDPDNPDDITWTPLTDELPSLAIGSIAFSPLDPSGQTIFAGTGSASSLGNSGGLAVGVYRTTDGGATWEIFQLNPGGSEPSVRSILPTSYDADQNIANGVQQVVLVGTSSSSLGLLRSTDGGQTYTGVSGSNGLPNGAVTDIIVDPNDASRYYAGVINSGVYRSDDGGLNWVAVNTDLTNTGANTSIQLTASPNGGGPTILHVLISSNTTASPPVAFTSDDAGADWDPLAAIPAGFIGSRPDLYTTFASDQLVVDPTDPTVVYIAKGYGGGAILYRYNPGTTDWTQINDSGTATGTNPHVDSRDLVFLGSDVLLHANDGGIYFMRDPLDAANNDWQDFIGHTTNGTALGSVEVHNLAWDNMFDVAVVGTQDNGTSVQDGAGSLPYNHFNGGDGGDVNIDAVTRAGSGESVRYVSQQNMGGFKRVVFDSATNIVESVELIPAGGLAGYAGGFVPDVQISVLNPAPGESKRIVIGGVRDADGPDNTPGNADDIPNGTVYMATNAATAANAAAVDWTQIAVAGGSPALGSVTAMALGGRLGGVDNQDVLYVGDGNGRIYLRSTAGGSLAAVSALPGSGGISDIFLDPNNWQHVFVLRGNRVFESTNAGADWTERTGNLSDPQVAALEFIDTSGGVLLASGNEGVHRMRLSDPGRWSLLGAGLPNAVGFDMDYDEVDDQLLVGTFGRGVWGIASASTFAAATTALIIEGDNDFPGQDDLIELFLDASISSLLHVLLNGVEQGPFEFGLIEQIIVNGLGGNDTLRMDHTNGLMDVPHGTRFDGGIGFDLLQVIGSDGSDATYEVGPAIGAGLLTLADPSGTATTFFMNLEPVQVQGPGATSSLAILGPDSANSINYVEGPNSLSVGHPVFGGDGTGIVTVDTFESVEFSGFGSLIVNGGAGSDVIHLNNPTGPTDLATIVVNGQDDTAGDTLIVNGVSASTTVNTATRTITGASGGPVSVQYDTVENMTVVAGGSTTLGVIGSSDYTVLLGTAADRGDVVTDTLPIQFIGFGSGQTLNLDGTDDLVIHGTAGNDTFSIAAITGHVVITGRATVQRAGTINDLILNGHDGDDLFSVTGPQPYATINIAGGNPSASDVLNLVGDGASALTANLGSVAPSVIGGGLGTVHVTGIELLSLDASGQGLTVNGTTGNDTVNVLALGLGSGTVAANGLSPAMSFIDASAFTVNLQAGDDALIVSASNGADDIAAGPAAVAIAGVISVNHTNTEALTINAMAGVDIIDVTPGAISIFVDGGNPIGVEPGDTLKVQAGGGTATVSPGPENDEGGIQVTGSQPVSFDHIESLAIDGAGGAIIAGTGAADSITVIARDSSTHAGTDGVQDFTAQVNDGPEVLFINTPFVAVEAKGGSDEIVLRTPAPNNADWDVQATIDGGPPSASDRLVVETPGAGGEIVQYVPATDDSGTLIIIQSSAAAATNVTVTGIEELVYDGEADNDSLTVVGTALNDLATHTPGADDQAGSIQVNTLLPLAYQNLGPVGSIASDGMGGIDTLVAHGTEAHDAFAVSPAGQVGLNARLPIQAHNTEALRLEGLHGDDRFDLLGELSAVPFTQIRLNGGTQSSINGDQASMNGTAASDLFNISGTTVTLGGVTVVTDGVENSVINADGGTDQVTYTGVAGLSETISFIASNVAGDSRLRVPGVASYNLTSLELVEAVGNDGTGGDTDTVEFHGTNLDNTFDIELNTAGTPDSPVVELRNTGLAATLLTLVNYTGFQTLIIRGLEGTDTFNVKVGSSFGRQIYIDGGLPEAKTRKKPSDPTDILNFYYRQDPDRPSINHAKETQNQNAGLIDATYKNGTRSLVQYLSCEKVNVLRA